MIAQKNCPKNDKIYIFEKPFTMQFQINTNKQGKVYTNIQGKVYTNIQGKCTVYKNIQENKER